MTEKEKELQSKINTLEKEIEKLKKSVKKKKYGLVWMDVPEAFEDDLENKLPILTEVKDKTIINNDNKPAHILIEGDNYHALTCLNYTHKEKIDIIYIDPPYNTGSDGFRYKDKRFIEKFPDGQEVPNGHPFRHTYWLSFMKKRLELAKTLLCNNGLIFTSIDDNELSQLKLLYDEIFGEDNFLAILIWRGMHTVRNSSKDFNHNTEYILCYSKNKSHLIEPGKQDTYLRVAFDKSDKYTHDDNDDKGKYKLDPLHARNYYKPYTYKFKNGIEWSAPRGRYPAYSTDTLKFLEENNEIYFGNGEPKMKRYLSRVQEGIPPNTLLDSEIVGFNKDATSLLYDMFGTEEKVFNQPKPFTLIKYLLNISSKKIRKKKNQIILDFFAGSGTTGHAIMQLNEEDDIKRQIILVTNNENNIMTEVCYPRIEKVIKGYKNQKKESVVGLGNSLKYYKTDFVGKNKIKFADDLDAIDLAHKAGYLLAIAENTLFEIESKTNKHFQFFENNSEKEKKYTAVYFREELDKLNDFIKEVGKLKNRTIVYIFSWGEISEYTYEFDDYPNVRIKTIPQPILEIYKSIYNLEEEC